MGRAKASLTGITGRFLPPHVPVTSGASPERLALFGAISAETYFRLSQEAVVAENKGGFQSPGAAEHRAKIRDFHLARNRKLRSGA